MTPILTSKVERCAGLAYDIEVDDYVPLRLEISQPSFGSVYLRIGNYSTSLTEILVNRLSRVLQGVTLTFFESYSPWPRIGVTAPVEGLPVLTGPWDVPERDLPTLEYKNVNLNMEFSVSLRGNELLIFWGDLANLSGSSVFQKLQCYVKEGELRGVRIFDLNDRAVDLLHLHGNRSGH